MADGDVASSNRQAAIDTIIAQFSGVFRELKCVGFERLVRKGVSMTNLHTAGLLAQHGEMPMSRLAELLDVSLSNATGLIDRMEERGFVERVRVADDRRIVLVRVTELGRQLGAEMEGPRAELLTAALSRLSTQQLVRAVRALEDVSGAVDAVMTSEAYAPWHRHVHAGHGPAAGHADIQIHSSPVADAPSSLAEQSVPAPAPAH